MDLGSLESVTAFIVLVKNDPDLSKQTKTSLQLIVLNKAMGYTKKLEELWCQILNEYEENILSTFN